MDDDLDPATQVHFNGIDGATGGPLIPPQPLQKLIELALADTVDAETLRVLQRRADAESSFAPPPGVNPCDLASCGWGYLAAHDEDPAILEALKPLLDLRRQQAGARFYEWTRDKGYRTPKQENKYAFLKRLNVHLQGYVDPERAPYYLLLIGSPEKIPFRFQHDMDVEFAVGRVDFDTPEEYRRYAESVVAAEQGQIGLPRRTAFFGVCNDGDPNTSDSIEHLVRPLVKHAARPRGEGAAWEVQPWLESDATKAALVRLLGGDATPAFLFTASHGVGSSQPWPEQREKGGALICQEYRWGDAIEPSVYFAASDLSPSARVAGLVSFHFACHSAGTPRLNDFVFEGALPQISETSFVSRLPQRLLAHPNGGALAVVGHINTALGDSYRWPGSADEQLIGYKTLCDELMKGMPLGWAMEGFGARYGNVTVALEAVREDVKYGRDPIAASRDIVRLWTSKIDARSFVVLGDPAVRLCVGR